MTSTPSPRTAATGSTTSAPTRVATRRRSGRLRPSSLPDTVGVGGVLHRHGRTIHRDRHRRVRPLLAAVLARCARGGRGVRRGCDDRHAPAPSGRLTAPPGVSVVPDGRLPGTYPRAVASRTRAATYARRRKRRMARVEHDLSDDQWVALMEAWGGCAYCGGDAAPAEGQHVADLARWPLHTHQRRAGVRLVQRQQVQHRGHHVAASQEAGRAGVSGAARRGPRAVAASQVLSGP